MPFPQFAPKADWALLRKLAVEDGITLRDLAVQFGVSVATISWHAKRDNWNLPAVRKAKTMLKAALNGQPTKHAADGHLLVNCQTPQAKLLQLKAAEASARLNAATVIQRIYRKLASMPVDDLLASAKHATWLRATTECANVLFGWNGAKVIGGERLRADLFALSPDQLAKLAATEIDVTPVLPVEPATPVEPQGLDG